MQKVCLVVPVDIKHPLDMVLNAIHFMYTGKIKISDENVFQYFTISTEVSDFSRISFEYLRFL